MINYLSHYLDMMLTFDDILYICILKDHENMLNLNILYYIILYFPATFIFLLYKQKLVQLFSILRGLNHSVDVQFYHNT